MSEFDVFLAHSSKDKAQVRAINKKLKQRGLKPWLDEEQIPPGRSFQDEIQRTIPRVKSAAIFIGSQQGRWQLLELKTFISQCVNNRIPVIPILLPGVDEIPDNLPFLKEFSWVSFELGIDDTEALKRLVWGITGEKPQWEEQPSIPITEAPINEAEELEETDDLRSEKGVDYTKLKNLLAAGKWKEADEETLAVMLKAADREKEGYLDTSSIQKFPCTDLRTIDQLWVKYSNGHFGFSVQKRIWLKCDGKVNDETEKALGDALGWRKNNSWLYYNDITFSLEAPEGHLPSLCRLRLGWRERGGVGGFGGLGGGVGCFVCLFVLGLSRLGL